jgi:acetyltransferase
MIELLTWPIGAADLRALAALLADAVNDGASLSFLPPLGKDEAARYWEHTLKNAHPRSAVLVARDAEGIAGTVQLQTLWAPNQVHRAQLVKLIVHPRTRRKGVARALIRELELRAAHTGFTMLTLEARRGDPVEGLYQSAGWTPTGVIPLDCIEPDGSKSDTIVYYKFLTP